MIPTRIGQQTQSGTFTGFNRINNQIYGIIVAPKWTEVYTQLKNNPCKTRFTQSLNDGASNTSNMESKDHPSAAYCKNLIVNGVNDWYLPSINELELCYRYLKPTSSENITYEITCHKHNQRFGAGTNPTSVPTGVPYTATTPTQTIVTLFQDANPESFTQHWHWSSTEFWLITDRVLDITFLTGKRCNSVKSHGSMVRAIRRVPVASKP